MREPSRYASVAALAALAALLLAGCTGSSESGTNPASETVAYVPGLGEIMSLQQMRHIKLWFAGQARNWPLATYEIDELGEGFDDVVSFHPTLGDRPLAPRDLVPQLVVEPLDSLRAAVGRGDPAAFDAAFDALTSACNSCHQAMDFSFNRVQRPTLNPYANQVFTPAK